GWEIGGPSSSWAAAWRACEAFVTEARQTRTPVGNLVALLKRPPLGMREGPIPVLLCAMLINKWQETALYEEGVFVPELRIEVIERLIRRPETFEIQSHQLTRHERAAIAALRQVVAPSEP